MLLPPVHLCVLSQLVDTLNLMTMIVTSNIEMCQQVLTNSQKLLTANVLFFVFFI